MKIGLISDIHGNVPALRAVLDELSDVDKIIHAGDIVGYGPAPNEAVEILQSRNIQSVQGNHDRGASDPETFAAFRDRFSPVATRALRWTRDQLTQQHTEYLSSLPTDRFFFDDELHLVHGSPENPDQYVYPEDFFHDLFTDETILVMGHTHIQAAEWFDGRLIVNPGSIGQPRDSNSKAAYAVFDFDSFSIQSHRISYPVDQVRSQIRSIDGLPDEIAERI